MNPKKISVIRALAPDASTTPVRLYQLFSGLGSGGVVVQAAAAQLLKDRGWTVSEEKLGLDEIEFLSKMLRLQGEDLRPPPEVHFVRCEGVAREDAKTGQIRCEMPATLNRAVVRLADARPDLVAPALAILPSSAIAGVAAVTLESGAEPLRDSEEKSAAAAVEDYRKILNIYTAYTEYLLEFPEQGQISLWERNVSIRMRNLLGKLAGPASLLGVAGPAAGAIAPLGGPGAGDGAGLIFTTNSPQAARRILGQSRTQLETALNAAQTLSAACCKRLLAIMEGRSPTSWATGSIQGQRLLQVGTRLLASFGCRPMREIVLEKPPIKEIAIAGATIASMGLALYGWRRWKSARG